MSYETDNERIDIPLKNAVDIKIMDLNSRFLVHPAQPKAISTLYIPNHSISYQGKEKDADVIASVTRDPVSVSHDNNNNDNRLYFRNEYIP